jgi:inner membrane protein
MKGKSHVTIGIVTSASVWAQPLGPLHAPLLADSPAPQGLLVGLLVVALGSLLPDIDHAEGTLARERVAGVPVFKLVAWGVGAVFGHRGPTHSLLALAALLLLGEFPWAPWAFANLGWLLGWGYALHLAADSLTKAGIPLFWPLPARFGLPPWRRLRLTTGSWREGVTVLALMIACIANAVRAL